MFMMLNRNCLQNCGV